MSKIVKVGIVGFGTVGAGVAENIIKNSALLSARSGVEIKLEKIADLDITTDRGVKVPKDLLCTDANVVIDSSDIVVELVGGTTFAKTIIINALKAKKHVVTANKALLALHGKELFAIAQENGVDLYYEASVAGGIPIIKSLREGLVGNNINRIYGIMNGTCNYILTRMEREGLDFDTILADAQNLGYAEANPSLDIDGFDTAHKCAILGALAYGKWFGLDPIYVEGIRGLSLDDLHYADELGYRIKLLAIIKNIAGKVQLRVHPTLIAKNSLLANISEVFNGVMVEGDRVGQTLFYGRGAGREATASAVVGDIVDIALNIKNSSAGRVQGYSPVELFDEVTSSDDIESRYYLRLKVSNSAGVISAISKILTDKDISISSIIQHEVHSQDDTVPVIILTHNAKEKSVQESILEIEKLEINQSPVKLMRIEDL